MSFQYIQVCSDYLSLINYERSAHTDQSVPCGSWLYQLLDTGSKAQTAQLLLGPII